MWKASVSGWRVAAKINMRGRPVFKCFLWRDALVCIVLLKGFDFSKCVSALGTFLTVFKQWVYIDLFAWFLQSFSFEVSETTYHHFTKSAHQHSYTPECNLVPWGQCQVVHPLHRSWFSIGQHPWGSQGSYGAWRKCSLAGNESENSGTWKCSQGLQNWLSPSNKSTAKTSQETSFNYVYWSSEILNLPGLM